MNEQFHAERRTCIGGSDAAALCGMSPFKTKHEVYLEKMGLVEPTASTDQMVWGTKLEPVIATWYADERGVQLQESPLLRHPEYDFIGGHVDRLVMNGSGPAGILEVKTTDSRNRFEWGEAEDDIPAHYNIQVQHYMMTTGLPWCDVAVLIGGNDFRIKRVERHDDLLKSLIQIEIDFWREHVLKQIPPDVDDSEGATRMLKALYPSHVDVELVADEETVALAWKRIELAAQFKKVEAALLGCDNRIKAAMGDKSIFAGEFGRFLWRQSKDRVTINYKAVLAEAEVPDEIIQKHTTTKPGARPFLTPKVKKEEKSDG